MKKILASAALLLAAFTLSAQQKADWPNYSRYSEQNGKILEAQAEGAPRPLAVLMGDSITDGWYPSDKEFFEKYNLVGRGISGQCTAHMLARFQRDVVELKPKYVVIMAGTNDIALNNGCSSVENAYRNIISMCQIAKANKIKVILCSTTPAADIPWRPEVTDANAQERWLNESLKEYAREHRLGFADYAAALGDENGATDPKYSKDGVHPNIEGYKIMEDILLDALHIKKK
ncbi:MAG: GDSL-type esterase/lipase family protein [Candidatus Cryptobacteroides sp.]